MRAVMAVLRAAGNLKRRYPDEDELVLMLRSIIDVNLCKFLAEDVPLFRGIVGDLFIGITLPEADYTLLRAALIDTAAECNLQPTEYFLTKTIQLYEMIVVRHGLMTVGHPFSAKTSSYRVLSGVVLASRRFKVCMHVCMCSWLAQWPQSDRIVSCSVLLCEPNSKLQLSRIVPLCSRIL